MASFTGVVRDYDGGLQAVAVLEARNRGQAFRKLRTWWETQVSAESPEDLAEIMDLQQFEIRSGRPTVIA